MVKNTALISVFIVLAAGTAAILLFPYQTVNPGVLIEEHMYLKNDCLSCHSLGSGAQTGKCINCHKLAEIGIKLATGDNKRELNNKSNLLHQSIQNIQCLDCHTEHNGLSRENATLKFRHSVLSQNLMKECIKCHFPLRPEDNIHAVVKEECSVCHITDYWKPSFFKHELLGEMKNNCRNCHLNIQPADVLHGSLGSVTQCVMCHSIEGWKPSSFDHLKFFRFDLNHPAECKRCHDTSKSFSLYTCYNCHEHSPGRIAEKHIKEGIVNFVNCVNCHRSGDEMEAKRKHRRRKK